MDETAVANIQGRIYLSIVDVDELGIGQQSLLMFCLAETMACMMRPLMQ